MEVRYLDGNVGSSGNPRELVDGPLQGHRIVAQVAGDHPPVARDYSGELDQLVLIALRPGEILQAEGKANGPCLERDFEGVGHVRQLAGGRRPGDRSTGAQSEQGVRGEQGHVEQDSLVLESVEEPSAIAPVQLRSQWTLREDLDVVEDRLAMLG